MSTLTVATVKSNSSSPPAFQNTSGTEIGRLCRAWVNFDGTGTVAIRAQFNVSSITDNGTGDYTVNFTNALADSNYAITVCGYQTTVANTMVGQATGQIYTSSAVRVCSTNSGFNYTDCLGVTVSIFR